MITAPIAGTEAVTILILLPVGSRYETKEINGASHFIEHMMFKGTERRPSNLAIAKELDALGADYNAFTGKDLTGYWIKLDKDNIETGVEILSDILFNSLFDRSELERERGVILEEIKMYEDNPLLYIDDLFEQTLYNNHPLGWSISGKMENIRKISYQEILDFKNKHYRPNQMLIAVAGNIEKRAIKKIIVKFFGQSSSAKKETWSAKKFLNSQQTGPIVNILTKDVQQIQLALGFPAYSYFHPKLDVLTLFSIILGGNMSSRLFTEVRVKRGLAYFVKTDLSIYKDTGNFVVRAGIDKEKIKEATAVILEELKKIRDQGAGADELARAKTFFEGKLSLELEDSASVASWYAKYEMMLGKIFTPAEKIAKIKKITNRDVQLVAKDIIRSSALNLAIIGPAIDRSSLLPVLERGL